MSTFTSKQYYDKCHQYLAHIGVNAASHNNYLKNVLKAVVQSNTIKDLDHATLISYMLKRNKDIMISFLHEGVFRNVINLKHIEIEFLKCIPAIYGKRDWSAKASDTIEYYNILKFLGQYTRSQEVYEACINILLQLMKLVDNKSLPGMIIDYRNMMYLFNFNSNVDTSKNPIKLRYTAGDNYKEFNSSIYQPEPNDEYSYRLYTNALQWQTYCIAASSKTTLSTVLFLKEVVLHGFHETIDSKLISKSVSFPLTSDFLKQIDEALRILSTTEMKEDVKSFKIEPEVSVYDILRFVDAKDPKCTVLDDIAHKLICYPSDTFQKQLFEKLYELKLTSPDSNFSHNIMRHAVYNNRVDLVKYLISQGVKTTDLPTYRFRLYGDLQLIDIAKKRGNYCENVLKLLMEEQDSVKKIEKITT